MRADTLLDTGDMDRAATWRKIIAAIESRCGRPNQKGDYIRGALPQLMAEKGRNFMAGRRQPRYEREIEIEISGRKYSGRYVVERGLLTVYYAGYKSTHELTPGGSANARSMKILRELVAEEAARGKAENSSTD